MSLFNNKRKDYSIRPPRQQVNTTPFFVTDSANIDFTLSNLNLTADLTFTGVVAGTYGDATNIPVLQIDQWGRVTGITLQPISPSGLVLETNGTANTSQTILNLTSGTDIQVVDLGGGVIEFNYTGSSGNTYTADNGLTPEFINPNNFQLGGSLIKSTIITSQQFNGADNLRFDAPSAFINTVGAFQFTAITAVARPSTSVLASFRANDCITAYFETDIILGSSSTAVKIKSLDTLSVPLLIEGSLASNLLKVLDSGQLELAQYNTSTSFQGVSSTSVGILNVDNAGKVFVGPGGGVPTSRQVATADSLTGGGDLSADRTLSLVNDQASPGANKVYGTDSSGTKGWKADPSGGGGILHATASGTNTYTASVTPTATSYNDGDAYLIRFTNGNDQSAPTLNIDGLGGKVLYRNNDGELLGGDISDGGEMLCVYNTLLNGGLGAFQCIGISPNSLFAYVTNVDTVAITKGMPVVAWGGTGDRMTVQRAYNTDDAHSAQTVGLVFSNSIGVNQKGFIMIQGLLDGLTILKPPPFDVWVDGDPVYLGASAGTITKAKPHAPNHLVYLGVVTTTSPGSAGRMYVRVQNGYELDELHDVALKAPYQVPVNNDVLTYITGTPNLWQARSVSSLLPTSVKTGSCGVTFDGGGQVIQTKTAYVQVPYNGTLTSWTLVADVSGSCTITVFKDTYANYPPTTTADDVYVTAPSLSSQQKNQNLTPTYIGSQATVTAGDYIGFTISAITTITWANLTIQITKT